MINKTGGGVPSTDYIYDVENRLVEVRKNAGRTAQYEYDGDGGRTKKVTYGSSTSVTTFVGSLYEESGFRETKYIFLGGTRIASVTNGAIMYYHADHLGGTNVLSDNLGTLKELIEYEPYGQYARHEKYGSSEEIAWFYFTGKKLDDETGLYYFGARYYDPKLGRFITADEIVQNPYDPQTLNRYSYTSNNPVNRIDPDGRGWFKKFIKKWAGLFGLIGGVVKGAVTGDWSTLQNQGTALVSSAVLSGGNPFAIAASVLAAGFMDTPSGRQFSRFMSEDVMDDAFGMRPRAAYIVGNMVAYATVTSAFYITLTTVLPQPYTGPDYTDPANQKGEISKYGIRGKHQPGGSSTNYIADQIEKGTDVAGKTQWVQQGRVSSEIAYHDTPFLGKAFKALNARHAAALMNVGGKLVESADVALFAPLKGGFYGSPWTATSHQAFFRILIDGGMTGTQALGAATSQAGWSFYLTSSIYGVEGHSGAVSIINAEVNRR